MTPSRPHVRWNLVADTLFSQPVGHETKVDKMVSNRSMELCADESETLNLSRYLPGPFLVGHVPQEHEHLLCNKQGRQPLVVVTLQANLLKVPFKKGPQTGFLGV